MLCRASGGLQRFQPRDNSIMSAGLLVQSRQCTLGYRLQKARQAGAPQTPLTSARGLKASSTPSLHLTIPHPHIPSPTTPHSQPHTPTRT